MDDGGDKDGEEASEVMHSCSEETSMVHKPLSFCKNWKNYLGCLYVLI